MRSLERQWSKMKKLIAINIVKLEGKVFRPGETLEANEKDAKFLISEGAAKETEDKKSLQKQHQGVKSES